MFFCGKECTPFVHRSDEAVEILHCAEDWINGAKVGDVVAEIRHWTGVDWAQPYGANTELFEIAEFLNDS